MPLHVETGKSAVSDVRTIGLALACAALLTLNACVSASDPAIGVTALLAQCGAPGPCGQALACEGKMLSVRDTIDPVNVFDRRRFPNLPYEKFSLTDRASGSTLEVWAASIAGDGMLQALQVVRGRSAEVSVRGRAVGVDLPIASRCIRTIKLELASSHDLSVGNEK